MWRTFQSREILNIFRERFEANRGQVYHASDFRTLSETLTQIIKLNGVVKAVAARIPPSIKALVMEVLDDAGVSLVEGRSASEVSVADAGLTLADYGIADTGTLVEITELDRDRLVSSLPRIHITFLNTNNILPKLEHLTEIIRSILSKNGKRCCVSLISGPSRTADIELQQVLGVHGPHQVHAIIGGMV
ncbi:MAG: LUD domain-containing protein [Nitrososphaerota archaeon]